LRPCRKLFFISAVIDETMKKLLLPILLLPVLAISCSKEPSACFTAPDEAEINESIEFVNCSANATGYYWWFDDNDTSHEVNPVKSFSTSGPHLVYLTAYGRNSVIQSKYNRTVRIVRRYIEQIQIKSLDFQNWDTDGTGPDLQLIYGSDASKSNLSSREFPDILPPDLPISIRPFKQVELTDTSWHFTLIDRDGALADTLVTWRFNPVEYGRKEAFIIEKDNHTMELSFYFE